MVSKKLRERGDIFLDMHFAAWSYELLLLSAKHREDYNSISVIYVEKKNMIVIDDTIRIRVIREDDKFKINEN